MFCSAAYLQSLDRGSLIKVAEHQVEMTTKCSLVLWLLWINTVNGNFRCARKKKKGSIVTSEILKMYLKYIKNVSKAEPLTPMEKVVK